ncbi:MAG: nitroreductase family protein [Candidatus Gracilibacteria bacterium]|jgi:nitroreductase
METLEAIKKRRSIRKFKNKEIPEDIIKKILMAGMQAPSAGGAKTWHFIVVKDQNLKDQIPEFSPFAEMIKKAPLGILVCSDLNLEKYKGFWQQDCAAAIQNMLLSATDLGLGAVWTGVYPMEGRPEGYKKLLNIPKNVMPVGFVVIGYPAEEPVKTINFMQDRVHENKW